jgi:hypothetical protein
MDSLVVSPEPQDIPDQRQNTRGFRAAVVVSLLLHLLVIFGVVTVRFEIAPATAVVGARPAIVLTLRQRIPRSQIVLEDGAALAQTLSPALKRTNAGPVSPPPLTTNRADESRKTTSPVPTDTTPVFDENRIAQSIANYMATYRPPQQDAGSDKCPLYRRRNLTDDCPQEPNDLGNQQLEMAKNLNELFTSYVTGHARNARVTQGLLAEMDRLRPLMSSKNPVLAQVARASYYDSEDRYFYLTGGHKNMQLIHSAEERAEADSISFSIGAIIAGIQMLTGTTPAAEAKPYSPLAKPPSPPAAEAQH